MGIPKGDMDRPWFSSIFVLTIYIYIFKYSQVSERCVPNRTHHNGRPKGDGGEVYMGKLINHPVSQNTARSPVMLRRSARINKGKPPRRFYYDYSDSE